MSNAYNNNNNDNNNDNKMYLIMHLKKRSFLFDSNYYASNPTNYINRD